jgi:hypothetical protein
MLVTEERLLDAAGRPRSPATMPGYHAGRPPRNKGIRYPADPPRVEEIVSPAGRSSSAMARAASGVRSGMDEWGWEQLARGISVLSLSESLWSGR